MKGNDMDKNTTYYKTGSVGARYNNDRTLHRSLQVGCEKLATGANASIKSATKGTTMRVAKSMN
ncbi:hypothetical protein DPMN_107424 [Dreissena polymorpha]|uniref:Uncharacterized protein n=1 Tax=Dreissena polymorpha TaxID=45954 RepID=A0A9D4QKY0_DREPO|nr:hypothetical protein DPMN_107424 [Dreissena polymorpha]